MPSEGGAGGDTTTTTTTVCSTAATLHVRSDREWFHVDIALRAERDGALFAERTWTERFPRRP